MTRFTDDRLDDLVRDQAPVTDARLRLGEPVDEALLQRILARAVDPGVARKPVARPRRPRTWRTALVATGLAAALLAGVAVASIAVVQRTSGSASGAVVAYGAEYGTGFVIAASDGPVEIELTETDADTVLAALRASGIDHEVVEMPVQEENVGRLASYLLVEGDAPPHPQDWRFWEPEPDYRQQYGLIFSMSADPNVPLTSEGNPGMTQDREGVLTLTPGEFEGRVILLVGRAARPGERWMDGYQVASVFGPGEPLAGLHCTVDGDLDPATAAAAAASEGYEATWEIMDGVEAQEPDPEDGSFVVSLGNVVETDEMPHAGIVGPESAVAGPGLLIFQVFATPSDRDAYTEHVSQDAGPFFPECPVEGGSGDDDG
jgi:hypothetical protein